MERALVILAETVGSMVERLATVEERINATSQPNGTYTVQQMQGTPTQNGLPAGVSSTAQVNSNGNNTIPPIQNNGSRMPQSGVGCNNSEQRNEQGNGGQPNIHANNFRRVPIYKWNFHFTANSKSEIPEEKDAPAFLKRLEILVVSHIL